MDYKNILDKSKVDIKKTDYAKQLEIFKTRRNDISILNLKGTIDVSNYDKFYEFLNQLVNEGVKKFIIDCELSSMNSLAIGGIMQIAKILKDKGSFRIVNPDKKLSKIIKSLNLQDILLIYDNLDSAIESIEGNND